MVQPLTLLQQMKMVAQQFLGLVPTGSYYDFNGVLYQVGGMDPTTGKIILNPVTSGSTTLMDPIAALYPNAVPAPLPTASAAAASSGGTSALSAISGIGPTLAPLALSKLGKHAPPPAAPVDPNMVLKAATPDGISPQLYAAEQKVKSISGEITNNFLGSNYSGGTDYASLSSQNAILIAQGNAAQQYSDLLQKFKDQIAKNIADIEKIYEPYGGADNPYALNPSAADQARIDGLVQGNINAQNQINHLTDMGVVGFQNSQMTKYQADLNQLSAAQTQVVAQQTYESTNTQLSSQASGVYANLSAPQKQAYYDMAAKELRDAKLPATDADINARAQQDFASNYQLTSPQDQAAFNSMVRDAAANAYAFDTGDVTADFNKLSPQVQAQYLQDAYKNVANTPEFQAYLDKKKQTSIQQKIDDAKAELRSEDIQAGVELFGAAMAGYGEETAIESLFKNGFSFKALIGAVGAGTGMYVALHLVNKLLTMPGSQLLKQLQNLKFLGLNFGHILAPFLKFISGWQGFLAIQGLIILLGWLFGKKPPPEQAAAETLNQEVNPMVWNPNGQVIFLTAGLTMATLGLNLSPSAPMMQTMTLSQAAATDMLLAAGASQVPTDNTRYADVFVERGAPGAPTRVVYLTPAGTDKNGKPIETLTVQTLNKNFQFAQSQPPTGFIPFFIPGPGGKVQPNPQVVQNLSNQQHLLLCADGAWVTDASLCAAAAGAASHSSGGH